MAEILSDHFVTIISVNFGQIIPQLLVLMPARAFCLLNSALINVYADTGMRLNAREGILFIELEPPSDPNIRPTDQS